MPQTWMIILLHQFMFQGMFVIKNMILYRKIRKQIRGKNREATLSIAFFAFFIGHREGIVALLSPLLFIPNKGGYRFCQFTYPIQPINWSGWLNYLSYYQFPVRKSTLEELLPFLCSNVSCKP